VRLARRSGRRSAPWLWGGMGEETPAGGADVGYAVHIVRPTSHPVIGPPLVVDSDRRPDIGHSVLVTKRDSRGHADNWEK